MLRQPPTFADSDGNACTTASAAREATNLVDDTGQSPYAFADDVADILTRVTDNLGSISELFAGQEITPNVEQVAGLIGADLSSPLPAYRSEPIQLPLYIDSRFEEFGLRDKLLAELREVSMVQQDPRLPAAERQEAAHVMQAMRDRFAADKTAYINSYTNAATKLAESQLVHAPVEVVVIHDYTDDREIARDPLASRLHDQLVQATPVPATGKTPEEHPGKSPADVARSYHARIEDRPTTHPPARRPVTPANPTQMIHQAAGAGPSL